MNLLRALETTTGFDWDKGNSEKNWIKHKVSRFESEEVFYNEPFFVYDDKIHSIDENRFYILGQTNEDRKLFIVFVIRNNNIRIISARDMNKKERKVYEELKKDSKV